MNHPAKNIDTYISSQPKEIQPLLSKVRECIAKAVPAAEETISYQMPAFRYHGMLVYFAAFTKHYSIFAPQALNAFEEEITAYRTSKATLQFQYNKPVPVRLITRIVKYAAKVNEEKALLKKQKKRS